MAEDRRYTEKETALILKKAAALQARGPAGAQPGAEGHSLAEIESAALEAGMSAELVRRAAGELGYLGEGRKRSGLKAFVGADWDIVERRILPSIPDKEKLDELLMDMGTIMERNGAGSASAKGLAWSVNSYQSCNSGSDTSVRIQARADGGAELTVSTRLAQAAGGIYGGMMGGIAGGVGMGAGMPIAMNSPYPWITFPLILLSSALGSYGIARLIFTSMVNRERKRAASAADELERRLGTT